MIYGPNTEAAQSIIDRIPTLTEDEDNRLDAARSATWGAAIDAAWDAYWDAAWDAARSAAWGATLATITYDLATETGPYTIAQRDLLLAPWVEVCGMPEGLDGEGSGGGCAS